MFTVDVGSRSSLSCPCAYAGWGSPHCAKFMVSPSACWAAATSHWGSRAASPFSPWAVLSLRPCLSSSGCICSVGIRLMFLRCHRPGRKRDPLSRILVTPLCLPPRPCRGRPSIVSPLDLGSGISPRHLASACAHHRHRPVPPPPAPLLF